MFMVAECTIAKTWMKSKWTRTDLVSSVSHALGRHTVSFSRILFFFCKSVSTVAQSCLTLCDRMDCSMPGLPVHHQPLEFTQTHAHEVGDAILYCPLLFLPSVFPSIRVFSSESAFCIRWPKYWSFSFNTSPSNEYSGLISFRMDWLDLRGLSRIFSNTTVQKHQFFRAQLSL